MLFKPKTRAIPSPTARTLPVSFKLASSDTPLILSSKMEETSVGCALVEANLLVEAKAAAAGLAALVELIRVLDRERIAAVRANIIICACFFYLFCYCSCDSYES
ncbi:hypothetical protein B6A09_0035 [Saccharomyces cerevisiae synthetic construct]|uniref:Putative uncharacterized protein YBL100C n=1 Tax=Saccharomyces cerevisiae (strain ATCC 204508 / S288c) TaxID=559292 RepID=YBK0_YEAST|nr:RecName: Full=Putative uncharacterized protein YBL100C [Saccharomyces cerevisiae S288C]AAT93377.1 YBL100C [Saccharomyces cerevisiae]ARB01682.1 hypothetical protein B6A09_0035 [Saccharomyces cerevisiae synthetic construct]WNV71781.1 hypothetical protein O6U65_0007 [Saccharomyces cerevisiae synthetic construct]CAA56000.1 F-104 protein [Saccharomyces cerevisiae]CAA84923.1 unnamed protein product [Saccharomyces cerevisiae]